MKNEIILKKVIAKLEQDLFFEKEAGIGDTLKKVLVGIGLLGSLYNSTAYGRAADVVKGLKIFEDEIRKIELQEEGPRLEFKSVNFKPSKTLQDGNGDFTIKYGPYTIKADFFTHPSGIYDYKIKMIPDKTAPKEQLDELKDGADKYMSVIKNILVRLTKMDIEEEE